MPLTLSLPLPLPLPLSHCCACKVNLCFWGHNHVMQRQAAVYNQQVVQASRPVFVNNHTVHWHENPQAPVHMVSLRRVPLLCPCCCRLPTEP